ncbi:MAG: FliM/FliN family flagellar motor switch protein [Planctomycetaceae bacterium]
MSDATPFDFTKSRGLDPRLENRILTWLDFFRKSPARLERSLGVIPTLQIEQITSGVFSDIAAGWPGPAVGCGIDFGIGATTPTLLVISGTMARALVGQMLGAPVVEEEPDADGESEEGAEAPEPEPLPELTRVEQSMLELFVSEVTAAMIEAWPDSTTPPTLKVGNVEVEAARSRFVSKTAPLVSIPISVTIGSVTESLQWLLPPTAFAGFEEASAIKPTAESRRNLERLVRSVPVELVVKLGEARLLLRDLAQLKAGDLIILDKKIGQPLSASIGRGSRFVGWPGRVGSQQAYQIEELNGSRPEPSGRAA